MEDRTINLNTNNKAGLYKMIEGIFRTLVYSQREFFTQLSSIRQQGKEIYETSKKEFLKSQRARTFFGLQNTSDALKEANDYALSQMNTFLNGFQQQKEDIINAMIQIAKESPEQFLNAIKGALSETGNKQLQEPGEEIGQYDFEEILNRMKAR
jgi:hypothetical protein